MKYKSSQNRKKSYGLPSTLVTRYEDFVLLELGLELKRQGEDEQFHQKSS